jgi:hypothetical protein
LYRPHIMITNTALFGFLFVLKKTAAIWKAVRLGDPQRRHYATSSSNRSDKQLNGEMTYVIQSKIN